MASIQNNVQELKDINTEIKRLQIESKRLKKRAQDIEKNILSYLNEKEQPGLKYQNTAIIIENKAKRVGRSKKDNDINMIKILEENGVYNAREILNKIKESGKGEQIQMQKVKLQTL
jgi:hypothetical protein